MNRRTIRVIALQIRVIRDAVLDLDLPQTRLSR
jgi:hypothetical protein